MPQPPTQSSQNPIPPVATASPMLAPNAHLMSFLILAFAFSLVFAAFGYEKYRARQRSRLLKRQIAMLEAMWRISSTKR